ncbi:MAG: metal-sensitive transcriptional regulator [bacterium]|nr:metal-sensitive transcriptional regulator [bacterium]
MLDDKSKRALRARLRRAEGQVAAIGRMIDDDSYCVDVLLQIAAAQGALSRVGEIVLDSHVRTCVRDAFDSGDEDAREAKIDELMEVFSRWSRQGAR